MIAITDWNFHLKKLYESHNVSNNIEILITKQEVFTLDNNEFGVKCLEKGKLMT